MPYSLCYAHVPLSTVTEQHGCQSFGCGLQLRGFGIGAAVRSIKPCPSELAVVELLKLVPIV